MPRTYTQTFTVSGRGYFPLDMLRYDHCWPRDSADASNVQRHVGEVPDPELTSIQLERTVKVKTDMPTVGRWASFLWAVSLVRTEVQ